MTTEVSMFDPKRHLDEHQELYSELMNNVLSHGRFINGPEVTEVEEKLASFLKVKHAIGVSSGTDALLVALMAVGVKAGDEVITVPFTWISTAEVICLLGAKPVFCDINDKFCMEPSSLNRVISRKTKAVIPISMFGQLYDVSGINSVIENAQARYGTKIYVIEDGAQSFGAERLDGKSCAVGDIGCTSFFPTKPLGCFGDGGMCFTNNNELAKKMRMIKNHGCQKRYQYECVGINGRLDTLQAAVLLAKIPTLDDSLNKRERNARKYDIAFKDNPNIIPPSRDEFTTRHVYAQYTLILRTEKIRDQLKKHLDNKKIGCGLFYPVCLHLVPAITKDYLPGSIPIAEKLAKRVISIPCYPELKEEEQDQVIEAVKSFFLDI